jgi:hypothetical protein
LPAPLSPPECNLGGYPSILIDIPRLRQSDFDASTDDTAWRAGFNLWFSAWESTPAGSLRADDPSLAKAAGLGRDQKTWGRVKKAAMQGFVLCSDGRVYHRTVCTVALGIWIDKLIRRHAGQRGNRGERAPDQREAELLAIVRQIGTAAHCLRVLDPVAPALAKTARYEAQCEPQCGQQSGGNAPALGPQEKGREGNGGRGPSQEGGQVVAIGGIRA